MTLGAAPRSRAHPGVIVASARPWLRAGVLAGPLFLAVSFAQMPGRVGFDPTRHAFSFLLLGPGGWVQTLNFVVSGALFIAAGAGLRRAGARAAGVPAAVIGLGLIGGGAFPPDPYRGYPPGAGEASMSASGLLHAVCFFTAMLSWVALLTVLARWFARHGRRGPAAAAVVTVVLLLAVPATTGQWFDVTLLYVVVSGAYLSTAVLIGLVGPTTCTAFEPKEAR